MDKNWQRRSGSSILTRRTFLGSASLMAAGLAVGGSILAPFRANAQDATPKKGGRVRLATVDSTSADSLDPANTPTFTDIIRSYFVFEKLTEIDPAGNVVPQLATAWSSNADASVWTFELRQGVVFHNGKTLTPADVVYSYQRILKKETASQGINFLTALKTARADGGKIVFELSEPYAEFPFIASMRWMAIVPEGSMTFPKDAIGTGPWKVADFQPGITALFTRNENYWRSGLPYIDEIESFGIGEESARLSALLSGDADIVQSISPKAVPVVEKSGTAKSWVVPGGAHPTFAMKADAAPFDNLDVRLALKHAFDRKQFIDVAFGGLGEIGRDNPVPHFDPNFSADVPVPTADGDKVKFHLKKAGMENATFELNSSDANYGGANAAVVLAELMKQNGANVTAKKNPSDSYWSAVYMKVPFFASSWTVRPTAITRIEGGYVKNTPYNEAFWWSEKVDSLIAQAKRELDAARRKEMLGEAQMIISTEGASIIPVFLPWIDAHSTKVRGLKDHPSLFCGSGQWTEAWLDA